MPSPSRLRSPWTGGALLLALVAGLVAPLLFVLGRRGWPFVAGAAALLLLVFGAVERLWQSRPLAARNKKKPDRSRFRVFTGGKGRGNGHAQDASEDEPPDDPKKPRWLM